MTTLSRVSGMPFEFLGLAGDVHERRLERSLVAEIERFMIELGAGFAFVGRQVQLDVYGEARYALNGIDRPVGVARYTSTPTWPSKFPRSCTTSFQS